MFPTAWRKALYADFALPFSVQMRQSPNIQQNVGMANDFIMVAIFDLERR